MQPSASLDSVTLSLQLHETSIQNYTVNPFLNSNLTKTARGNKIIIVNFDL